MTLFRVASTTNVPLGTGYSFVRDTSLESPWHSNASVAGDGSQAPNVSAQKLDKVSIQGKFIQSPHVLRRFLRLNGPQSMKTTSPVAQPAASTAAASMRMPVESTPDFLKAMLYSRDGDRSASLDYFLSVCAEKEEHSFDAAAAANRWAVPHTTSPSEFADRYGDTFVAKTTHGPGAWFRLSFPLPPKHRANPEAHKDSLRSALDGLFKQDLTMSSKMSQDAKVATETNFEHFLTVNAPHVSMASNVDGLAPPESLSDVFDIVKSIANGKTESISQPSGDAPPLLYMQVQPYSTLGPQSSSGPAPIVSPHYAAINDELADRYLAAALWQKRIEKLRKIERAGGNSTENQQMLSLQNDLMAQVGQLSSYLRMCAQPHNQARVGNAAPPPRLKALSEVFSAHPIAKEALRRYISGDAPRNMETKSQNNAGSRTTMSATAVPATSAVLLSQAPSATTTAAGSSSSYPTLASRKSLNVTTDPSSLMDNAQSKVTRTRTANGIPSLMDRVKSTDEDNADETLAIHVESEKGPANYKVTKHTPLGHIFGHYCRQMLIVPQSATFMCADRPLHPAQTPAQLGLMSGDKLKVFIQKGRVSHGGSGVPNNALVPHGGYMHQLALPNAAHHALANPAQPNGANTPRKTHTAGEPFIIGIDDPSGVRIGFKVTDDTPLHTAFKVYFNRTGASPDNTLFTLNNVVLSNHGLTMGEIGLAESSVIRACDRSAGVFNSDIPTHASQRGSYMPSWLQEHVTSVPNPVAADVSPINLQVKTNTSSLANFKVLPSTLLQQLHAALSQQTGRPHVALHVAQTGCRVDPNMSVAQAGLRNGDVLVVT